MKARLLLIAIFLVGVLLWHLQKAPSQSETPSSTVAETPSAIATPKPSSDVPVSPFFDQYGQDAQSPEEDLANVVQALEHFWLLIKDPDALSVMSNQTVMRSLIGENPHKLRLIAANHPFLNPKGELLDRWKTPLAFHPHSMTEIEIRSAGPDQKFYTEDDLVNADQVKKK